MAYNITYRGKERTTYRLTFAVYISKPTMLLKSHTCFWQIVPGSRALEYTLRPWILELVPAPHSAFYVCREELQGISPQTSPYLYKTDNKSLHQPAEIKTENLGLISPCKNDHVWWMAVKDPSSLHDKNIHKFYISHQAQNGMIQGLDYYQFVDLAIQLYQGLLCYTK